MDLGPSRATHTKLRKIEGRLRRLRSETTSPIRGRQNRDNEICSGMKSVSAVVMFPMFKWYLSMRVFNNTFH